MTANRTAVHAAQAGFVSQPSTDIVALPAPVQAIRAKILTAVATGDVEALRIPIDWNEMRPLFAASGAFRAGTDPIEILKSLSFDKKGLETLQIMRAILAQPYVRIARSSVKLCEWPAFVRRPSPPLDERDLRARWRCVRFSDLGRSNKEGQPRATRLGVTDDGVWQYFWSEG